MRLGEPRFRGPANNRRAQPADKPFLSPETQVAPLTSRGATYSSSPESLSHSSFWPWHILYLRPEPHGHCAFLDVPGNVRPSDHGVFSSSFFGRLLAGTLPSAWLIGAGPVIGAVASPAADSLADWAMTTFSADSSAVSASSASSALSTSELATPTASSASSTTASSDSMPASSLLDTCCTSTWKSSWTDSSLIASIMELYIW